MHLWINFLAEIYPIGRLMQTELSFDTLGLSENLLNSVKAKGFEQPTPVQARVIPRVLTETGDIIAKAQTGTGKTAAFALPILDRIDLTQRKVQALILVPTRELALQAAGEFESLLGSSNVRVSAIYGGRPMGAQIGELRGGAQIVVGTPGRIIDHLERKTLDLSQLAFLVLDEADEMLDMGFVDDIELIIGKSNPERRILLFSATMPDRIRHIAEKTMRNVIEVNVLSDSMTTNLTEQKFVEVREEDKAEALFRFIETEEELYALVFCRTKMDTDNLGRFLESRACPAASLHGDMSQAERERVLDRFRAKKIRVLVATDVAARGIDISNITHVFNYGLPDTPEAYVHRIGRTGRAGKTGTSITFVSPREFRRFSFVRSVSKAKISRIKVPSIEDVIVAKQARLIEGVILAKDSKFINVYREFAKTILADTDPEVALAATLAKLLGTALDPASFKPVIEIEPRDFTKPAPRPYGHSGGYSGGQRHSGGGDRRPSYSGGGDRERSGGYSGGGDRRPSYSGGGSGDRSSSGGSFRRGPGAERRPYEKRRSDSGNR